MMARPKGIPHTKIWKKMMSKLMKSRTSHPNSLKALRENGYVPPKGNIPWNKGLTAKTSESMKKGVLVKRKYKFSESKIQQMIKELKTLQDIANYFGCSKSGLYEFLKKQNIKTNSSKIMETNQKI